MEMPRKQLRNVTVHTDTTRGVFKAYVGFFDNIFKKIPILFSSSSKFRSRNYVHDLGLVRPKVQEKWVQQTECVIKVSILIDTHSSTWENLGMRSTQFHLVGDS